MSLAEAQVVSDGTLSTQVAPSEGIVLSSLGEIELETIVSFP